MTASMTGYGHSRQAVNGYDIAVEIKSVNHRYGDYSIRVPRVYGFLEEPLKSLVKAKVSRGKIEIFVTIYKIEDDTKTVKINHKLAGEYIRELKKLGEKYDLKDDISITAIGRFSDIFESAYAEVDQDLVYNSASIVANQAIEAFTSMREVEGKKMADDMLSRNAYILSLVEKVDILSPNSVIEYRNRIEERIKELLGDVPLNEERLLTETAILADKWAVDEETVRLKSHICEFNNIMESSEPVGRKLDFLLQEMNREVNTIGSKCNNLEISKIVVEIKSELEKIREQVQNIE